jgi:hypothetical protein
VSPGFLLLWPDQACQLLSRVWLSTLNRQISQKSADMRGLKTCYILSIKGDLHPRKEVDPKAGQFIPFTPYNSFSAQASIWIFLL